MPGQVHHRRRWAEVPHSPVRRGSTSCSAGPTNITDGSRDGYRRSLHPNRVGGPADGARTLQVAGNGHRAWRSVDWLGRFGRSLSTNRHRSSSGSEWTAPCHSLWCHACRGACSRSTPPRGCVHGRSGVRGDVVDGHRSNAHSSGSGHGCLRICAAWCPVASLGGNHLVNSDHPRPVPQSAGDPIARLPTQLRSCGQLDLAAPKVVVAVARSGHAPLNLDRSDTKRHNRVVRGDSGGDLPLRDVQHPGHSGHTALDPDHGRCVGHWVHQDPVSVAGSGIKPRRGPS